MKTVTAFTISHSITLTAATLGFVHVPPRPVEAVIALSIVFVAAETLQMIAARRHRRAGAMVSGIQLRPVAWLGVRGRIERGRLAAGHIPLALLFFSGGVETGHFLFIGVVLVLMRVGRIRLPFRIGRRSFRPTPSAACHVLGHPTARRILNEKLLTITAILSARRDRRNWQKPESPKKLETKLNNENYSRLSLRARERVGIHSNRTDADSAEDENYDGHPAADHPTPDAVETRLGTLKFVDGSPDYATVAKVYANLDFERGVQPFLTAMPGASTVDDVISRRGSWPGRDQQPDHAYL